MTRLSLPLVATLLAAPALAQEGLGTPVYLEPASSAPPARLIADGAWTGFYLGAQIGTATGEFSPETGDDLDTDGLLGGLHLGYDADLGGMILGGVLAYDKGDLELGDDSNNQITDIASAKLRAGLDAGDLLPYLTLGAGFAQADINSTEQEDWGWIVGLGADLRLNPRLTIGVEALRHSYSDFDDTGLDGDLTTLQLRSSLRF